MLIRYCSLPAYNRARRHQAAPTKLALSLLGLLCFPSANVEAPLTPGAPEFHNGVLWVESCYPLSGHLLFPTTHVSFNSAEYSSIISFRLFSSLCFLFSVSLWILISWTLRVLNQFSNYSEIFLPNLKNVFLPSKYPLFHFPTLANFKNSASTFLISKSFFYIF